ncbi:MAG TPA: hypothetical protein VLG38_00425 [Gammaproteobacteria bacterium]|nr:hypothetical protein [Gammaproteobacteria bacterium]
MQDKQAAFQQHGVIKIPGVLDPATCELLTKYVRMKAQNFSNIRKGNDPLSGVHREYGDPMMETLLDQFTPMIEAATGLSLWPTLSFYYHYTHGNILAPHKDRSSCEVVAGLCIGADPEYRKNMGSWPLLIKDTAPLTLDYGDLVIFRGHTMQHWREKFTGAWFISAIFGYVDQNGPFSFQKYDQRSALGKKHVGMLRWYFGIFRALLRENINNAAISSSSKKGRFFFGN